MMARWLTPELRRSQEFQSGMVRLLVWSLMVLLFGLAGYYDVYQFDWGLFTVLFLAHLAWYVAIQIHVIRHPQLIRPRTYLGVVADMSGTSLSIYLSGNPISPFALLYVLSYLSQGTRFGRNNLMVTSIASVIAFSLVSAALDGWQESPIELVFMLLFMVTLPLYQYALLNKLQAAKQAAEDANRARGTFLATMTHELRTPLSGVIGMAGLLGSTRLDEEQKEYLDSVNASATMLQSLIGDILDLSKIDAGKLELKPAYFDVRKAVLEVSSALSNQALEKQVDVVCSISVEVPERVYGDELRFRQVLFNLIGNAVKFTEHGEVCTDVRIGSPDTDLATRHLRVSVRDTGIGIDPKKLTAIFDSFWQADSSTTRRYGGTGLGTTISRDLVRLMGGVIGVQSEQGKGTEFWIKLPLIDREALHTPTPPGVLKGCRVVALETGDSNAALIRGACQTAHMRCEIVSRIEQLDELGKLEGKVDLVLISDSPAGMDLRHIANRMRKLFGPEAPVLFLYYPRRKAEFMQTHEFGIAKPFGTVNLWENMARALGALPAEESPEASGVDPDAAHDGIGQVLVAEDDAINGKLINSLLTRMGYQVKLVRDGEAALHEALTGNYDVVLADLRMPKMDGIDFARALRAREPAGQRLPIFALTANAAEDARAECIDAGMDEYLTKPVDAQMLADLLRSYRSES